MERGASLAANRRAEITPKVRAWRNQCLVSSCHWFYSSFPLDLLVRKHKTEEVESKRAVTLTRQPSSGERGYWAVGLRTTCSDLLLLAVPVSSLPRLPRRGAGTLAAPSARGAAPPAPSPSQAELGLGVSRGGCW